MNMMMENYWNGPDGENSKYTKYAGPSSIPSPSMCDFCRRKGGWGKIFLEYFGFSLHHSTNVPYSKFGHILPVIKAVS